MTDFQFLKTAAPRVLVDIETLYDLDKAVLDLHEKEFGTRTPPTWSGTEYPITRNVSTKYGKRLMTYYKEVRSMLLTKRPLKAEKPLESFLGIRIASLTSHLPPITLERLLYQSPYRGLCTSSIVPDGNAWL